jgi:hypothetical protein
MKDVACGCGIFPNEEGIVVLLEERFTRRSAFNVDDLVSLQSVAVVRCGLLC